MKPTDRYVPFVTVLVIAALAACDTPSSSADAQNAAAAGQSETLQSTENPAPPQPQGGGETALGSPEGASKGKLAFNNICRTCHSAKKGDNRLGPSLFGVVGRKAGLAPGYAAYSGSVKNSGITWDEQTLDRWIENPDSVIAGNNMKPYAGLKDPEARKQIIEYLKTTDDDAG